MRNIRFKYFLRGFGIGIIFLTIVFSLIRKQDELTDAEIKKRASELGMVTSQEAEEKRLSALREAELSWKAKLEEQKNGYEELLSQKQQQEEQNQETIPSDMNQDTSGTENDIVDITDVTDATETTETDNTDVDDGEADEATSSESVADGDTADERERDDTVTDGGMSDEPDYVHIDIVRGMTSGKVAKLLEEKGVIKDADEFDRYLTSVGKAASIRVGTYQMPVGADYADIAKAITE